MPCVSVNLCAYNGEAFLREALDSICAQTFRDWELVIVDDGSTDATGDIVGEYIGDGWPIRYHYQENAGLGAARNRALELSSGDHIAFIDQDDIWCPKRLELQVELFELNPRVGLVYGDAEGFYDGADRSFRVFDVRVPHRGMVFREVLGSYCINLQTVILRRKALESMSEWFDVDFRYSEEADLFLRLLREWEADYVEEVVARYRIHDRMTTRRALREFAAEQEAILDKLAALERDFSERFADEVRANRALIARTAALGSVDAGDRRAARAYAWEYREHASTSAFLGIYASTFLSRDVRHYLQYLYRRFGLGRAFDLGA